MAPRVGKQLFRMLLAIPVAAAAIFAGLQFLLGSNCRSREIAGFPRPGGGLRAVIYERDCGPQADTTTQVALIGSEVTVLPDTGNVAVVTGPPSPAFGGAPEVRVIWAADTLLLIQYGKYARVLRSADRVNGVAIQQSRFD